MEDLNDLELVVDMFAQAMKAKLRRKAKQGYSGGLLTISRPNVAGKLSNHARRNDRHVDQEVDIANLAMMLWYSRLFPEYSAEIDS